jgi:hypothetical protein
MTHAFNFGAKIAASMCSPCDMPNSASNKKHMTGASPAVTEAGEKSEEIGKPPVTETEHSEAEAKQPEEGVKSAAKPDPKAMGQMFSRMLGAAKPAAGNAADLAASLSAKAKTTAARTGNNVVRTNPATGVQETLARAGGELKPSWLRNQEAVARGIDPKTGVRPGSVAPAPPPLPAAPKPVGESVYAAKPGGPMDFPQAPLPKPVSSLPPTAAPPPASYRPNGAVPVRKTNRVVNGATGQVTGGSQPAPSWVTANRDAQATALAKARAARPGAVPPPTAPPPRP